MLLLVLFSIFLTGCISNTEGSATSTPVQGVPVLTVEDQTLEEIEPAALQIPTGSPENAPALISELATEIPIPSSISTEQSDEASLADVEPGSCSPLSTVPIEELSSIISSPYQPPPPGKEERHHGVDFSYYRRGDQVSIEGQEIQSIFGGIVSASISESFPYGNFVIIETKVQLLPEKLVEELEIPSDRSLYILYAHMAYQPSGKPGEEISECTILGAVGKSGNAGIPHLHLETRIGPPGETFEAMAYYSTQTSEIERSNYERWRTGGEFVHFDPMRLFEALTGD